MTPEEAEAARGRLRAPRRSTGTVSPLCAPSAEGQAVERNVNPLPSGGPANEVWKGRFRPLRKAGTRHAVPDLFKQHRQHVSRGAGGG